MDMKKGNLRNELQKELSKKKKPYIITIIASIVGIIGFYFLFVALKISPYYAQVACFIVLIVAIIRLKTSKKLKDLKTDILLCCSQCDNALLKTVETNSDYSLLECPNCGYERELKHYSGSYSGGTSTTASSSSAEPCKVYRNESLEYSYDCVGHVASDGKVYRNESLEYSSDCVGHVTGGDHRRLAGGAALLLLLPKM
jgi:hypothetical protein